MNPTVKRVIIVVSFFIAPFILLLLFGCKLVPSFFIALIVDGFFMVAFTVMFRRLGRVKELNYEEICDRATEILFKLKQEGDEIEGVTLGPEFMEIEHKKKDKEEIEKSTIPFIAWGVDGKKTYIHASKAVKDYLGKNYSILMAGEYIVISKKNEAESAK